jgi:hypothetical protein
MVAAAAAATAVYVLECVAKGGDGIGCGSVERGALKSD